MVKKLLRHKVFDFGKYEGKTVEAVAENDPSYINWVVEHIPDIELGYYAAKKVKEWKEKEKNKPKKKSTYLYGDLDYPDLDDPMADDIFDHWTSPGFGL